MNLATFQTMFPELLFPFAEGTFHRNTIGHSGAEVWRLEKGGIPLAILKSQPIGRSISLQREADRLLLLQGHWPVPTLLGFEVQAEREHLLMSFVSGEPAFQFQPQDGRSLGTWLGTILRKLHAQAAPPHAQLSNEMEVLIPQTLEGLKQVDSSLAAEAQALLPRKWDLVMSHGDFCLPNVLLNAEGLSGLIDLGGVGFCDRYWDVSMCAWSLEYNQLGNEIPALWQAYDVLPLDPQRLRLMALLCKGLSAY